MPKRIKDYGTAATTIAADDYFAIDGVTNGTRKALLPSIGATGLLFGAGTAGAPLMAVGTAGNGVYAPSGNTLGFSTNGLDRWKIDSFGTLVSDVQSTPVLRFQPSLPGTTCGVEWFDTGVVLAAYAKYNVTSPQLEINAGKSGSTGRIVFYTNTTDVGRFTSAGSLLVGTNSEIGLTGAGGFRVASTTSAASSVAGAVVVGDLTAATTVAIGGGKVNVGTSVVSPLVVGGTATTQDLTFQTTSGIGASGADMHFLVGNNGATEAMTILNSGLVGIGTATPLSKTEVYNSAVLAAFVPATFSTWRVLQVKNYQRTNVGSAAGISFAGDNTNGDTATAGIVGIHNNTTGGDTDLAFLTAIGNVSYERLRINASGLVGIGTTAAGKALEINSATGANLRLTYNDSNGSAVNYADFSISSVGSLTIAPAGTNPNITLTPGGTGYTILNGYVGVGTVGPFGNLHVSGSTLITSWMSDTAAAADTKNWSWQIGSAVGVGVMRLRLANDAITDGLNAIVFTRTGISSVVTSIPGTTASTSTTTGSLINSGGFGNAGNIHYGGYLAGTVQSLTGAGAVNVTTAITEVTTTGAAQALTLADGVAGQQKTIIHGVDGGSFVLTPTTKTGWSTFTATAAGESITLVFLTTRGWVVKGSYLGTIAP